MKQEVEFDFEPWEKPLSQTIAIADYNERERGFIEEKIEVDVFA